MTPRFDIIIASDLRLPGGTTASIAEEVVAQHGAGFSTGLIHVPSRLSFEPRPIAPSIQALLDAGYCRLVSQGAVARLFVFRHPRVAEELVETELPSVEAGSALIVANQAPTSPDRSVRHYLPSRAHERLSNWLGVEPRWVPIGPLVRENLKQVAPGLTLIEDDWVNILDVSVWRQRRCSPRQPVRIGRHSRDHETKWPSTRDDILAAYPSHLDVRILGGARTPREILGGQLPRNWTVYRFDEVPVRRFLAEIDVFVYHHHPDWIEAFGRTIIEAMAAGLPAVLPAHFRPLFDNVAVYASPQEAAGAIERLTSDHDTYLDVSHRGQRFVAERFSHEAHVRRILRLVGDDAEHRGGTAGRSGSHDEETPQRPSARRVLLMSSNGAGVGHLMRLMAIARRLPADLEPVFLTLSQAVEVVRELGFHVEYLPSRAAIDAPHSIWHGLLERRLLQLVDELDVEAVVFDGTWPYNGLIDALKRRPAVRSVWSRRGMWRGDVTKHRLDLSDQFDLIIEPGELATEEDRGPTSHFKHQALTVGPVSYLRDSEILDRDAAREELGISRPEDERVALVQLGAGNINDTTGALGQIVSILRDHDPDLTICVTRSAIANDDDLPPQVVPISTYPLTRVLKAFDVAVAAAGYNTFHELLLAGVPTAFLPNLETATDDQAARARWAEVSGTGIDLGSGTRDELSAGLRRLLEEAERFNETLAQMPHPSDGAQEAAVALADLIAKEGEPSQHTPQDAPPPTSVSEGALYRSARLLYRRSPEPLRRLARRATGRMSRRVTATPEQAVALTLPPGSGGDASTQTGPSTPVLVYVGSNDTQAIEAIIDRVAALQRATGRFVPLFLTTSGELRPFRSAGYAVEVLPLRSTSQQLLGPVGSARSTVDRLREIQQSYGIASTVSVDPDDIEGSLRLLHALP